MAALLLAAGGGLVAPPLAAGLVGLRRRLDPAAPGDLPRPWAGLLGLATALLALWLVAATPAGAAPAARVLWVVVLATLAAVDLRTGALPDALLLPAAGTALVLAAALGRPPLGLALAGAAVGLGGVGALAGLGWLRWRREVLGGGDVKFAGLLGLLLGPGHLLLALDLVAVAAGLALLARRRLGRATTGGSFPLGPFLAAGGYLALLALG